MGYTHGEQWDEDKIGRGIMNVMDALCINRMPTAEEIRSACDSYSLNNAITRTGGFKSWAGWLNVTQTICETRFGNQYETIASDMLKARGYDVLLTGSQAPYDILVNGKMRVDVKAAHPYMLRGSRVHTFHLAKKYATCDIYMMFALNEEKQIERLLIVPWGAMQNIVTVCIGKESKYNAYDHAFEVFERVSSFYEQVACL